LLEIPGNPRTIASTMISTTTLATSRMKAGIIGVKGPHVPEAALLVLESVMVYFSENSVLWQAHFALMKPPRRDRGNSSRHSNECSDRTLQ
jgi:hypothetical protein